MLRNLINLQETKKVFTSYNMIILIKNYLKLAIFIELCSNLVKIILIRSEN